MKLRPITYLYNALHGRHIATPAGWIPMVEWDYSASQFVCLCPDGKWRENTMDHLEKLPKSTQRAVFDVLIAQNGGTASAFAKALNVSRRTVEAWRAGRRSLPIETAYRIMHRVLELQIPNPIKMNAKEYEDVLESLKQKSRKETNALKPADAQKLSSSVGSGKSLVYLKYQSL